MRGTDTGRCYVSGVLIDERLLPDGTPQRTHLTLEGDKVVLVCESGVHGKLSVDALARIMQHHGKPLDPDVVVDGIGLTLGDGRSLRSLTYRAKVDADVRSYLVWDAPGEEPLAAMSMYVAATLRYLVSQLAPAVEKRGDD